MTLITVPGKEVADFRGRLPVRKGANGYPNRPLEGITMAVIHYSGVDADSSATEIASYQTTKTSGDLFPECAYSFVIRWDGRIEQCHNLEKRSWHAGGRNNDLGIGICLPGNGWPTSHQLDSAAALIRALNLTLNRGGEKPSLRIAGHKELSATACPGPYWDIWKQHLVSASPPIPVVLGFRQLYDYLGEERCGAPLTPEQYDAQGNSHQIFTRCEMRWDKAENRVWISFNP